MRDLDGVGYDLGAGEHESKQKVVPGEDEGEDSGGKEAGARHWKHDFPENLPAAAAIDQSALFELHWNILDIATHHPDHVGQAERSVESDEPDIGIDPTEPDIEEEYRECDRHGRYHALRENPHSKVFAACLEARQRVRGNGAEDHAE